MDAEGSEVVEGEVDLAGAEEADLVGVGEAVGAAEEEGLRKDSVERKGLIFYLWYCILLTIYNIIYNIVI